MTQGFRGPPSRLVISRSCPPITSVDYPTLLAAIGNAHRLAQARAVNRHLVLRNWQIGAHLVEFEQAGEDRAKYGAGLLKRVSTGIRHRRPRPPAFVSDYLVALPKPEQLIETDRAAWEQHHPGLTSTGDRV